MHNIILQLTDVDDELAINLRDQFDIYLIPMINIDGVIAGNYRVNLHGYDLNRTYHNPDEEKNPTIFAYLNFIKSLQEKQKVYFFLDIHCHSHKFNTFIYYNPPQNYINQAFLELLEQNCSFFDRTSCRFNITKNKEKSARVVLWKQNNIDHTYTIEISYLGMDKNQYQNQHHSFESIKELSQSILITIKNLKQQEEMEKEKFEKELNQEQEKIEIEELSETKQLKLIELYIINV